MLPDYSHTIPDIFTDLMRQLGALVRTEAQLARAEASEKVSQVGAGLGLAIGAAMLLIPALVMLLAAAAAALTRYGLADYWVALIVGGAAFLVGLVLAAIGFSRLKASRLAPSKTIEQIQRDAGMAKRQAETDHGATTKRAA
jgi:hypothetical protein